MSPRFVLPALFLTFTLGLHAQPGGRGGGAGAPGAGGAAGTTAAAASAFAAMPDDAIVGNAIRLPDADIDTVLGAFELYTGKSIFRPATLPVPLTGGFNIMLTRPGGITKAEAIRAIETVLALNGIAVVYQDDKTVKVVQLANARQESPPVISGSTLDLPPSGRVATKIFQLNFLTALPVQILITNLLTGNIGGQANAAILTSANAVMVTDTVTNLQRFEKLLETLDRPVTSNLDSKAFLLKNARASTTLNQIRQALSAAQLAQVGGQISADDRANQILVVGDSRIFPFYEQLISKYDVKADPNTKQEVITLKSAIATEMIQILNTIISGQTQAAQRTNAATVRPGTGAAGQGGLQVGQGAVGAALPGTVAPVAAVAPVLAVAAAAPGGAAGGGAAAGAGTSANEFSALMTIVADPRTNSIVVNGTADDITLIRNLIEKLDRVLPQVALEVNIVEVTLSKTDTSGLSALGFTVGTDTNQGTVVPGATAGTTSTIGTTNLNRGTHITSLSNLSVGGWDVTGGVVNPLAFTAAMSNVGSRNNVKVLQSTTLTTSHNKQASFAVTQQQPIVTGTTAATATTASSSTVSYQNIGITLTVTPLIGVDDTVQMTLDQVVDSVVGTTTIDANTQPIIGHRQATSFINVKSGEMIVLGGLRTDTRSNSRSKLGFIWEIPVLSNLLGARTRSDDATELLFFVRPKVIKSGTETSMANEKINEMSNKEDVQQYLKDPSKPARESLLELVK